MGHDFVWGQDTVADQNFIEPTSERATDTVDTENAWVLVLNEASLLVESLRFPVTVVDNGDVVAIVEDAVLSKTKRHTIGGHLVDVWDTSAFREEIGDDGLLVLETGTDANTALFELLTRVVTVLDDFDGERKVLAGFAGALLVFAVGEDGTVFAVFTLEPEAHAGGLSATEDLEIRDGQFTVVQVEGSPTMGSLGGVVFKGVGSIKIDWGFIARFVLGNAIFERQVESAKLGVLGFLSLLSLLATARSRKVIAITNVDLVDVLVLVLGLDLHAWHLTRGAVNFGGEVFGFATLAVILFLTSSGYN